MNKNTPVQKTAPDVVIALCLFLLCILIALFVDSGSLVATFVLAK